MAKPPALALKTAVGNTKSANQTFLRVIMLDDCTPDGIVDQLSPGARRWRCRYFGTTAFAPDHLKRRACHRSHRASTCRLRRPPFISEINTSRRAPTGWAPANNR